ncbi:helix-turn-helix domain-containing protein [Kribbella sp. NPDC056861]|uniref:TetR/AcrR family transcriptional regulator n=1 Tax=Kribbella sp. NPDC056861 TaxID=3154857 RepID=UPI003434FC43
MRKDAQRNIEKLTAAAVELFTERGLDCPLDEIARRAGVSHGTLYSRFGTREALIDAVVPQLAEDQLAAAIQHAEAGADAWDQFARYVEKISELISCDPALSDAITRRYADTPRLSAVCDESLDRGREYMKAAHDAGLLRADFTAEDFILLFSATAATSRTTAATAPGSWRRGLAFTLDGLRATAAHPLPVGPLSPEQAADAMHYNANPSRT